MAFEVLKWLVESSQPSFNIPWSQLVVLIIQANPLIGRPLREIHMRTNFWASCIVIFKSPCVGVQFHSCPGKSDAARNDANYYIYGFNYIVLASLQTVG